MNTHLYSGRLSTYDKSVSLGALRILKNQILKIFDKGYSRYVNNIMTRFGYTAMMCWPSFKTMFGSLNMKIHLRKLSSVKKENYIFFSNWMELCNMSYGKHDRQSQICYTLNSVYLKSSIIFHLSSKQSISLPCNSLHWLFDH